MDPQETKSLLEKAAGYIREGNTKSARTLILQVLRADNDNAQAWYMLSYSVPVADKQIYALQQALRIKPNSKKIMDRLLSLGGQPDPDLPTTKAQQPAGPPPAKPSPEPEVEIEKKSAPPAPALSDEELLSRRLFGGGDEDSETPVEPEAESEQDPEPPADPVEVIRSTSEGEEPAQAQVEFPTEEAPTPKKRHRKVFGIRRTYFLLGILILIFLCLGTLGVISNSEGLLGFFGKGQSSDLEPTSMVSNNPTAIPTEESTPTPLPPTPTIAPSPTPANQAFSFSNIQPPSRQTRELMTQYEDELQTTIGFTTASELDSYIISEQNLQTLIMDFSSLPNFEEQVAESERFYQILDVASGEEDFTSFYLNYWVDPNGTFLVPGANKIGVVGFDFSDYQHYSWAQAYIQSLRREQFAGSPLFQPSSLCFQPTEECIIQASIIKGEASFSAIQWAANYLPAENRERIETASKKYSFTPYLSPPSELMLALTELPYSVGFDFAQAVHQSGGQPGLEQAYASPPATTEQLLHPEKFRSGELPEDVDFTSLEGILSDEWTLDFQGTIGEWNTYILLAYNLDPANRIPDEQALEAAAGWNGDHAQAYTNAAGEQILVIHWNWDTNQDAEEFGTALTLYSVNRTSPSSIQVLDHTCYINAGLTGCSITSDRETIWVFTPSADLAERILESYQAVASP